MPQKGQHIRGNNCDRYNKFRETKDRSSLIGLATWSSLCQKDWINQEKRGIERYEKPYELRSILKHSN